MAATLTGAEQVEWNLSDLYEGPDDPRIESELDEASAAASAFRERYRGKLGELSAAELNDAVAELERIKSVSTRVETYRPAAAGGRQLRRGARRARPEGARAEHADRDRAPLLRPRVGRARGRHRRAPARRPRARALRRRPPLRAPLQAVPADRAGGADLDGEERHRRRAPGAGSSTSSSPTCASRSTARSSSLDEALSKLARLTDQAERGRVAAAVTEALRPGVRTRGYVLNTILNERAIEDRLRGFDSWISARNLVERDPGRGGARASSTRSSPATTSRSASTRSRRACSAWSSCATTTASRRCRRSRATIAWDDAREIVLESFAGFSPLAGDIVGRFFERDWIDAAVRPGKMLGAFCATLIPERPPVRADELRGRAAQRAHARARARARPARDARPGSRPAERPHAADARRDGVRLRRGAHVRDAAGARGRPACRARPADRPDRRHRRDRLPSDRAQPLRARDPYRPARGGRASDRPDLRALERGAAADARRRGRGDGRLRDLVELRAALHPVAGLRLRVLVRLSLLARDLPALPRRGRGARRAVPGPVAGWRVGAPGRARVPARLRHRRPGLLVGGPRRDRRAGRRGRAARGPAR